MPEGIRVREGKKGKTYQARVMVDGKAATKSFRTLKDARDWQIRTKYNGIPLYTIKPQRAALTVGKVIERFISEAADYEEWARSRKRAYTLLCAELGHLEFGKFDREHVQQFAMRRRSGEIDGYDPVGPSTVLSEVSYLNVVWQRGIDRYGATGDYMLVKRAMKWLRADSVIAESEQRDRRPTEDELERLREYWRGSNQLIMPLVDMMDFTILTCVRRAELVRLRWDDFVDGDEPRILVRNRKDPKRKNNHMWLPLGGGSTDILKRQERIGECIWPYSEATITQRMWASCKALGIEGLSWHCFRHEGISRKFELGWSIPQVAKVSGHRTWENLERYTHLMPSGLYHLDWQ